MLCKLTLADKSDSLTIKIPQTFQDLCHLVFQRLNINTYAPFSLKYKDSDDELIMLNNQEDLKTAILTVKAENMKSLEILVFSSQDNIPNQEQPLKTTPNKISHKHFQTLPPKKSPFAQELPLRKAQSFTRKGLKHKTDPLFERFSSTKPRNTKPTLGLPQLDGRRKLKSFSLTTSQQDQQLARRFLNTCYICRKLIRDAHFICLSCPNKQFCESCESTTLHPHRLLKVATKGLDPVKIPFKRFVSKSHTNSPSRTGFVKKNMLYKSGGVGRSSFMETTSKYSDEEYRVEFQNVQEDLEVQAGRMFEYEFSLINTGLKQWPVGAKLVCINGMYKGKTQAVPPLPPQKKYMMSLSLAAADNAGKQLSQWQIHYQENDGAMKVFKNNFFLKIKGVNKEA